MSHDHVTREGVVYIARALKANFPILSLLLYSLHQHQSQVREFPFLFCPLAHNVWQVHQPYYLPFSALDAGFTAPPFLISALHYFEWHSTVHHYPLIIVQIHISPAFSFNTPVVHIICSPQYSCPSLHILWWDLPTTLPLVTLDYLQEYDILSSDNVDLFISQLDDFHTQYFRPITPYNQVTSSLRPPHTLTLPHTPANPDTERENCEGLTIVSQ